MSNSSYLSITGMYTTDLDFSVNTQVWAYINALFMYCAQKWIASQRNVLPLLTGVVIKMTRGSQIQKNEINAYY